MHDVMTEEQKTFVYDKFLIKDDQEKIIGMTDVFLDRAYKLFEYLGIEITVVYGRIGSPII